MLVNSLLIKLVQAEVGTAKQTLFCLFENGSYSTSWTENSDFTNIKQEINLQFSHLKTNRLDLFIDVLCLGLCYSLSMKWSKHTNNKMTQNGLFPYAKYISNPKWCITRNFSVDEYSASVKKKKKIIEDYDIYLN